MPKLVARAATSAKFWDGSVTGSDLVVSFGKLGTKGQTRTKAFASPAEAQKALDKVVAEKRRDGYTDEAAGPAAPAGSAAAPAPAGHPFRFYGRRPSNWDEGANEGYTYELQFLTAPSAATRAAIATVFAQKVAKGAAAAARGPWLWSGEWALLRMGERKMSGNIDPFCDHAAKVFEAIHAIAPIAQVMFCNSHGTGMSEWDAWTQAQQPVPTGGPLYSGYDLRPHFGEVRNEALPPGEEDFAFEALRTGERPTSTAGVQLVKRKSKEVLPRPSAPDAIKALYPVGAIIVTANGRAIAAIGSTVERQFGFVDAGTLHLVPALERNIMKSSIGCYCLSADGSRALLADLLEGGGGAVIELSIPAGTTHELLRLDRPITGLAFCANELVAVQTANALQLVRAGQVVDEIECSGRDLFPLRGGTVLVSVGTNDLYVVKIADGRGALVAHISRHLGAPYVANDRVFGRADALYELDGI